MLNLFLALIPAPALNSTDMEEGFLGKLVLWGRRKYQYQSALRELRQLDDHDLEDLGIGRGDFPELAWRHVDGAAPLVRPYR